MQIFQLQHPRNEIILCDDDCELTAAFLEVKGDREVRACVLHTHSAVHCSRLPSRAASAEYRSRPRDEWQVASG